MPLPLLLLMGGAALAFGAATSSDSFQAFRKEAEAERKRKRVLDVVDLFEHFPHYADPTFIDHYAHLERASLIRAREEILKAHQAFHADADFVALLRRQSPETYERACWRMKALAVAEQITVVPLARVAFSPPQRPGVSQVPVAEFEAVVEPAPDTPKKDADSLATVVVRAIRQQAAVERARLKATLDAKDKVQAMLRKRGLPEDEIEQLVATFMEDLAGSGSADGNGNTMTSKGGRGDIIIR